MEAKEWAESLIARQAWVFHVETYAVGQAMKFYDGETDRYRSKANGETVNGPVLELTSGHALMAVPEKWMELTKAEIRYFEALQEGFNGLIVVAARNAQDSGVELEKGLAMLTAILRAQLAALEMG
jgi:hypothetical protein